MTPFPEYQIVRESVRNKHEEDEDVNSIIEKMIENITYKKEEP